MNGAERWLHQQVTAVRRGDAGAEAVEESLAGIAALEAAGALAPAVARRWRSALAGPAGPVPAAPGQGERAQLLLSRLAEAIPPDPEWDEPAVQRFEAALDLLAGLGWVRPSPWEARLRERAGWASEDEERAFELEVDAGGTEADLLEVVPGPPLVRGGHRLLLMLRFADGVSFVLDKEPAQVPEIDWPEWQLTDDVGTDYRAGGFGGSDRDEHVSFRTPVPARARRLRLELEEHPAVCFEVRVG